MALPKRKISKSRGRKRRTHWKLSAPNVVECSHCHQPMLPHRACPNCGYYAGRQVFSPREA
ncbi:MAG: 50S ribosomal protein L32 [Calditrichaeota bacterium]|nr:50S ribosomal protein L32 [Calditrichota bacterium]TDI83436.1 MAG: 50S ribosomal protein L32 [Caldithrix sp.]